MSVSVNQETDYCDSTASWGFNAIVGFWPLKAVKRTVTATHALSLSADMTRHALLLLYRYRICRLRVRLQTPESAVI